MIGGSFAVGVPLEFAPEALDEVRAEVEKLGGELVIIGAPAGDLERHALMKAEARMVILLEAEARPQIQRVVDLGVDARPFDLAIKARVHYADITGIAASTDVTIADYTSVSVGFDCASSRPRKVKPRRCLKCSAIVPEGQRCPMCGGKRTH